MPKSENVCISNSTLAQKMQKTTGCPLSRMLVAHLSGGFIQFIKSIICICDLSLFDSACFQHGAFVKRNIGAMLFYCPDYWTGS